MTWFRNQVDLTGALLTELFELCEMASRGAPYNWDNTARERVKIILAELREQRESVLAKKRVRAAIAQLQIALSATDAQRMPNGTFDIFVGGVSLTSILNILQGNKDGEI